MAMLRCIQHSHFLNLRNDFKMIKIILILTSVLFVFIACESSPDQLDSRFVPPKGKILTFMHELDYTRYDHSLMPEMYGVAFYANIRSQVAFEFEKGQ